MSEKHKGRLARSARDAQRKRGPPLRRVRRMWGPRVLLVAVLALIFRQRIALQIKHYSQCNGVDMIRVVWSEQILPPTLDEDPDAFGPRPTIVRRRSHHTSLVAAQNSPDLCCICQRPRLRGASDTSLDDVSGDEGGEEATVLTLTASDTASPRLVHSRVRRLE